MLYMHKSDSTVLGKPLADSDVIYSFAKFIKDVVINC
jgi:hypothetical protein